MRRQVILGAEIPPQFRLICPRLAVEGALVVGADRVAHVPHRTVLAGHVPTAPAIVEIARLVRRERPAPQPRPARRVRENAADQIARHVLGATRGVARQAPAPVTDEARCPCRRLLQRVEGGTLLWVGRSEFQHVAVAAIADINVVVEIERPRRRRRNPLQLQTRFGKDERLGTDRHVECRQHRLQVAELRVVGQLRFARFDPLGQLRHRVVHRGIQIIDRRPFEIAPLGKRRGRREATCQGNGQCKDTVSERHRFGSPGLAARVAWPRSRPINSTIGESPLRLGSPAS